MSLDDLRDAWRRRGAAEAKAAADVEAARARARELDAIARRRDRREALVGLALVSIFGSFSLFADGAMVRTVAAIAAASSLAIPLWLRAARRRPDPGLPVVAFLRMELKGRDRELRLRIELAANDAEGGKETDG